MEKQWKEMSTLDATVIAEKDISRKSTKVAFCLQQNACTKELKM